MQRNEAFWLEELVSIIIPVYNVSRYLGCCLDTVLGQTYSHLEVILVDDGSTDGSSAICDDYGKRDARVRVIHQANAGAANAKNAGLDAAGGTYIAFLDSDDWVEPQWLERMLQVSQSTNADVVECSFQMEYTDGAAPGNDPENFLAESFETEDYLKDYIKRWTCALFWNKLFRAHLIEGVRFHSERRCVDDEFFTYKAVTGANCLVRITDALIHYRQRCSSVTQSKKTLYQRTLDDIDVLVERYLWMKKQYPGLVMEYLRHDVDTLLYLAGAYPFNDTAVDHFRNSAKFYFRECLCHFPGKVTLYYAWKNLAYSPKRFQRVPASIEPAESVERYYL